MEYGEEPEPRGVGQWLPTLPGHIPVDLRPRYMVLAQLPPERWWHLAYQRRSDGDGGVDEEKYYAIHRAWIISDRFDGDMRLHGITESGRPRSFIDVGITMIGTTMQDRAWASLDLCMAAEFPAVLELMDAWRDAVALGDVEKEWPWPLPPDD